MSRSIAILSSLFLSFASVTLADDARLESDTPQAAAEKTAKADIPKLIEQLDAGNFDEREQATQKLSTAGKEAISSLTEAAKGDSLEATRRALDILKGHFESDDVVLKTAAEYALKNIAAAKNENAARRAKQILETKPEPEPEPQPRVPGFQFPAARIQLQIQGGLNRRVQTRIIDGVKTIEAVEDGRKVTIVEDPDNGITVTVVEKKDGKEATAKYAAKNAEELKKEHPEAFKLYKEYSQPQAQIQINGIQIQNGALPQLRIPNQRGFRRGRVIQDVKQLRESLDKAVKQLEVTTARLKKLIDADNDPAELRNAIEELEAARKQLAEVEKRLEQ